MTDLRRCQPKGAFLSSALVYLTENIQNITNCNTPVPSKRCNFFDKTDSTCS